MSYNVLSESVTYESMVDALSLSTNLQVLCIPVISSPIFYDYFKSATQIQKLDIRLDGVEPFNFSRFASSLTRNQSLIFLQLTQADFQEVDKDQVRAAMIKIAREHPKLEYLQTDLVSELEEDLSLLKQNYRLFRSKTRQIQIENDMPFFLRLFRNLSTARIKPPGIIPLEIVSQIIHDLLFSTELWFQDELKVVIRCLSSRRTIGKINFPERPIKQVLEDEEYIEQDFYDTWFVDKQLYFACKEALATS